jgi:hypothetical protein
LYVKNSINEVSNELNAEEKYPIEGIGGLCKCFSFESNISFIT